MDGSDDAVEPLTETSANPNPIEQFREWFDAALATGMIEPNAMTLATATSDGRPSARMVLLKSFDQRGFVFYTNYESRKGLELAANPRAALVFFWPQLRRQVRIEGSVVELTADESDAYFAARARGSRIAAIASRQSAVLTSRDELDHRVAELKDEYGGTDVPRPSYWGGYRVHPIVIEFWQGRPNRLHDRLRYVRLETGLWLVERLSP